MQLQIYHCRIRVLPLIFLDGGQTAQTLACAPQKSLRTRGLGSSSHERDNCHADIANLKSELQQLHDEFSARRADLTDAM